jgi:hypothetical protein
MTKSGNLFYDPCPCGSGKPFGQCCFLAEFPGAAPDADPQSPASRFVEEIRQALEGQEFGSFEELQSAVDRMTGGRNRQAIEDFCGLSPEQMFRFLHFPFTSPDIARFAETLPQPPEAPVLALFMLLTDGCAGSGMKATAKGNLPRAFCQEAALSYWGAEKYEGWTLGHGVRQERDCLELNVIRLISELAGLLRKYRGRFLLTKKAGTLLAAGAGKVYLELFEAYAGKFNWGYSDGYADLVIVQQSFLYSLFLLHRFGDPFRPPAFYEEKFLRAFPGVLREIAEPGYKTKEDYIGHCYTLRTMERFAHFFGLIEIKALSPGIFPHQIEIRKSPLLDQFVNFSFPGGANDPAG